MFKSNTSQESKPIAISGNQLIATNSVNAIIFSSIHSTYMHCSV